MKVDLISRQHRVIPVETGIQAGIESSGYLPTQV